jgi:O-antigen/teichoic acid export membrane protein
MSEQSTATREAKGIGINLLTLFAQAALPAFHVQLARLLGAEGYGLYTWSNALVDMSSVITLFGMDLAVARKVSIAHANGDQDGAVIATGTALRVVLASGVLVAAAIGFAAPAIATFQGKPGLATPLRVLAIVPIAYHAASMFIVALQSKLLMKYEFYARGLVQPLSLLVLTTLILRSGFGLAGACAAVASGMAMTCLVAAYFYNRELPLGPTLRAAWRGPVDWSLVKMGLPLVLTNLVWALQGRMDLLTLGYYRSSEDAAAYGACLIYVISLAQVRGAFYPIVLATLPPALARNDIAFANRFVQRQNRWVAILAMPLFVLFAGFGDGLLAVFGAEFVRGAPAMAILAVGQLASAMALPASALTLSGNARWSALSGGICIALQVLLLPILVPRYGLTGAAISSATGLVASQVAQHGITYRIFKIHGFSRGLAKVTASATIAFALGRALFAFAEWPLAVRFFVGVGTSAIVYVIVLVALGLENDERAMIRAGLAKLQKRAA